MQRHFELEVLEEYIELLFNREGLIQTGVHWTYSPRNLHMNFMYHHTDRKLQESARNENTFQKEPFSMHIARLKILLYIVNNRYNNSN